MGGSTLDHHIRRSRGLWRDVLDLAELQGWRLQAKERGLLFYPPKNIARHGFHCIFAEDPGNESHKQRHLIANMKKAGLKFDINQSERIDSVTTPPKLSVVQQQSGEDFTDPFLAITAKINATLNLLSEIEQLVRRLEADTAKMRQFKELLKSLG